MKNIDEYTPCKKKDPTAREAIGNVMRLLRTQRKKVEQIQRAENNGVRAHL